MMAKVICLVSWPQLVELFFSFLTQDLTYLFVLGSKQNWSHACLHSLSASTLPQSSVLSVRVCIMQEWALQLSERNWRNAVLLHNTNLFLHDWLKRAALKEGFCAFCCRSDTHNMHASHLLLPV